MCVSGSVCAGVYRDALTEMEASTRTNCVGHSSHHGLHFHLQWPHRCTLGPGNHLKVKVQIKFIILFSCHNFVGNNSCIDVKKRCKDPLFSVPN